MALTGLFRPAPLTSAVISAFSVVIPTLAGAQTPSLPPVEVRASGEAADAGVTTRIEGDELERATDMADMVRYQPLVSAPGTVTGTSRNRSSHERSGTSGYNIRGVENNRIGLDVDGVELPEALNRPHNGRAGTGTVGIGRDYLDPELYIGADIHSGASASTASAGGIGGAVSFRTKSAADYLGGGIPSYLAAKAGHNTTDRSWHESLTVARRQGQWDGLLVFSRRDGEQSRNHSHISDYPDDWHSNALLFKSGWTLNAAQRIQLSTEWYQRKNSTDFDGWNSDGDTVTSQHHQRSSTERSAVQLQHLYAPSQADSGGLDALDTRLTWQGSKALDDTHSLTLADQSAEQIASGYETSTWGLSSTASKRLHWNSMGLHQLRFGLQLSHQSTERPWRITNNKPPYPGIGVPPMMPSQPDTRMQRQAIFLHDDISWNIAADGRKLTLTPGLRVERVQIRGTGFDKFASHARSPQEMAQLYGGKRAHTLFNPSIGLGYDLQPRWTAYALLKRGARAPTAGELFGSWALNGPRLAVVGNPQVKKETSTAIDLGLKGQPAPGITFNSALFYTEYKGFIAYTRYPRGLYPEMFESIPDSISLIYRPENRDSAKIYGMEISAKLDHGQWSPMLKGLHTTWALGASRGSSKSHYAGDSNKPLDSILPRKAIIGIGYAAPLNRWGLQLTGMFTAAKQATPNTRDTYDNEGGSIVESTTVELFRVPGNAVFDLAGHWQISPGARLHFGIYNLTNKRYWDYASARRIQPDVIRDQRDIELLTRPERSAAVSLSVTF